MKEKILKIINASTQSEPIYQLEHEYRIINNNLQRKEFFSVIKSLAINGTDKEKFVCLTIIEFLDLAKESEDVIKANIEFFDFKKDKENISPLLTLCSMLSTIWAIDFIKKIINHFKPKSIEYSYYFDIALRSIVSTIYWKQSINEIKWVMDNYQNDYIIDFIAYFKWKREESELEELFQLIDNNVLLNTKLKLKIIDRYVNNYKKIDLQK
ncbi:hypothetical protein [Flavobacterium seoulense]|uniref:Uncharacterized protein n=1 Tax=Flavobacterium seoulense TaxID=1492738 RepID=A0A066WUP6_9FLAO|nr:hypothetical protein [Flavobacterium seoulense]KDN54694.1 hypothetical protein FEM21_22080 [Flavobacterium seoulense]